jgi:DnaJ-like protein
MVHWYESSIDRQLREAAERGEFEGLQGAGKPLSDYGQDYAEDWWVKDWLEREGATAGVIPPTLALRRDVEDLADKVDRLHTEAEVREVVADLNERIGKARVGLMDGPPVVLADRDADAVVAGWRGRRATTPRPSSDRR